MPRRGLIRHTAGRDEYLNCLHRLWPASTFVINEKEAGLKENQPASFTESQSYGFGIKPTKEPSTSLTRLEPSVSTRQMEAAPVCASR